MDAWTVVLTIALSAAVVVGGVLLRRTKAKTDARIAERERAWDERERTWGRRPPADGPGR
jgi:hypothetical protein